jgi:hypothetical protein
MWWHASEKAKLDTPMGPSKKLQSSAYFNDAGATPLA